MAITFSKFDGDRETKSSTVFLDGVEVGLIEVVNAEVFQGRATMRRTLKFEEVTVALTGALTSPDRDVTLNVADGYTRATGIKAAKALLKTWLINIRSTT